MKLPLDLIRKFRSFSLSIPGKCSIFKTFKISDKLGMMAEASNPSTYPESINKRK